MTRPYHSPRRARDAAETRRDILRAATDLFSANGYARVTVADIAKEAGVAPQTVYASTGGKSDVLHRIIGESIEKTDSATVVEAVRRTGDLAEAVAMVAHGTRLGNENSQQVIEILFAALPVHEDGELLWRQSTTPYRQALTSIAETLRDKGFLAADVSHATDVLWFCFGFNAWRTLVKECGWTWDESERWLAKQAITIFGG
ncbi:TetR/AcrR family transcriptional regulator [Amycolatopsis oliviviridis]|uniref:TetR family transcriptional regulator n=1 Tax=Amycolatopsis oliviviridis TaxID=1471590 RepID=A0ABQ3MC48_9PSEU|nr:TetR/AcrR family transcriptional regulator [Amycolatopsis oliviviridis]GHH37691.1 TetR family transcriptional regulator [Amycolatopsis oliviviridis]